MLACFIKSRQLFYNSHFIECINFNMRSTRSLEFHSCHKNWKRHTPTSRSFYRLPALVKKPKWNSLPIRLVFVFFLCCFCFCFCFFITSLWQEESNRDETRRDEIWHDQTILDVSSWLCVYPYEYVCVVMWPFILSYVRPRWRYFHASGRNNKSNVWKSICWLTKQPACYFLKRIVNCRWFFFFFCVTAHVPETSLHCCLLFNTTFSFLFRIVSFRFPNLRVLLR